MTKKQGWFNQSGRHALASKGIRTSIKEKWKDKEGFHDQMAWEEMNERINGEYDYLKEWAEDLSEKHYKYWMEGDKGEWGDFNPTKNTNAIIAEAVDRLLEDEIMNVETSQHDNYIYAYVGQGYDRVDKKYGSYGEEMSRIFMSNEYAPEDEAIQNGKRAISDIIVKLASQIYQDFNKTFEERNKELAESNWRR